MKILVVDDDPLIRKSFQHILSLEGHEVMIAEDGLVASEQLAKQIPEIIICDMLMPEVSGLSFIKMLREHLHFDIPVIIISTLDKGDIIAANLGLKNIDFMPKPILFADLIQKVKNYSNKNQYENSSSKPIK